MLQKCLTSVQVQGEEELALVSSGFRERLPILLRPAATDQLALDHVTYPPGAQEHRHEVPEPRAQPN